jgi:hypothetical protein
MSQSEASAGVATEELLPAENSAEFWQTFNTRLQYIKTSIANLELSGDSTKIIDEIKAQKKLALGLQKYAEQSSTELPPYDIKRSQESSDGILREIKTLEDKYAPKKKFAFSKAAKASSLSAPGPTSSSAASATGSASSTDGQAKPTIALPPGSHVISDQVDNLIELSVSPTVELEIACQLLIRNNTNTTIHLPWFCGSVRLENNRDCRVFLGPCATSVYLEGQMNCTIFAACHQLRIHNSHGCRLYVRCASHPIIEDCSDMGFAPYALQYEQWEADMSKAGLSQAGCWDNVVDFRWHKTEASPNWFVIPESERIEKSL